jgi:hypothetical protein
VNEDQLGSSPRAEAVEDSLPRHRRAIECRRSESCRGARRVCVRDRGTCRPNPSAANTRRHPECRRRGRFIGVGRGAGNSSGTSAMVSPIGRQRLAGSHRAPRSLAAWDRYSANARQIGSGTPLARRSGTRRHATDKRNGFSPVRKGMVGRR